MLFRVSWMPRMLESTTATRDRRKSTSDPENDLASILSDSHAPPIRVMALHALAYCPRLFYLEEVEEIRVAPSSLSPEEARELLLKLKSSLM